MESEKGLKKMSFIAWAKNELNHINFGEQDTAVMLDLLERFFAHWQSGESAYKTIPLLQRLLTVKCLSPLTGEPDEWQQVGEGVFQNNRLPSVFKDCHYYEGKLAYDLDNPAGPRTPIEFPYYPTEIKLTSPVLYVETEKPEKEI